MKVLIAAAAVAAIAVPAIASAQTAGGVSYYGNLGYTYVDPDGSGNLSALGGKLGARFNPYIGVEADANFGVNSATDHVGSTAVKSRLQDSVAGYVVGFAPVQPNLDLFARLGYGNVKVKASASNAGISASRTVDQSDWNAGAGAQYFLTPNDGIRGEYTRYGLSDKDIQANAWSVSYVRRF